MEPFQRHKTPNWDQVRRRIAPFIQTTPLINNAFLNELTGLELVFKCENLQTTGAFKIRGAANMIMKAMESRNPNLQNGVVGSSSGNHGVALATLSRALGLPCVVVVPPICPLVKQKKIQALGGEIIVTPGMDYEDRERLVNLVAQERNMLIIPTGGHIDVIEGHGTIASEMHSQVRLGSPLDAILVPVSTGGMLAGCAWATHSLSPTCQVIAVEPEGKHLSESLQAQKMLWSKPNKYLATQAEGLKSEALFPVPFDICLGKVEPRVITVSDEQMIQGINIGAQHLKLIVEMPAGAAIAAAFQVRAQFPHVRRVGLILCGGNIDLDVFGSYVSQPIGFQSLTETTPAMGPTNRELSG